MTDFFRRVNNYTFWHLMRAGFFNGMSDEKYIRMVFKRSLGCEPDLENPQTFNEKLNWLKLHDREDYYSKLVDKYEVKKIVADKIGEEYVVPLLKVWDNADDVSLDGLPEKFVLKCTHDCGSVAICLDKAQFDLEAVKKKFKRNMKFNYYWSGREWPYKNVKPRVIAEEYIEVPEGEDLRDYKFFCFSGEPKVALVVTDRHATDTPTKFTYFDMDFNKLPFEQGGPRDEREIEKPENFEKMAELAGKLSAGLRHVRVDLYDTCGKIYFGELTFSDSAGFTVFTPPEWDKKFGDMIKL